MKVIISTSLLLSFCSIVFAQISNIQVLYEELSKDSTISFLRFDIDSSKIDLSSSASLLREILQFSQTDEMKIRRIEKDNLGYEHHYFLQYYKGIRVEHGRYSVHGKNGNVEYIAGKFRKIDHVPLEADISEEQALNFALKIVGAKQYKWEIKELRTLERFTKILLNGFVFNVKLLT